MFDFDDEIANFFDKTEMLENLNIPLTRSTTDTNTNNYGYWLIYLCKNNNLFIVSLLHTKLDAFTPSNENLDNITEDLALILITPRQERLIQNDSSSKNVHSISNGSVPHVKLHEKNITEQEIHI